MVNFIFQTGKGGCHLFVFVELTHEVPWNLGKQVSNDNMQGLRGGVCNPSFWDGGIWGCLEDSGLVARHSVSHQRLH